MRRKSFIAFSFAMIVLGVFSILNSEEIINEKTLEIVKEDWLPMLPTSDKRENAIENNLKIIRGEGAYGDPSQSIINIEDIILISEPAEQEQYKRYVGGEFKKYFTSYNESKIRELYKYFTFNEIEMAREISSFRSSLIRIISSYLGKESLSIVYDVAKTDKDEVVRQAGREALIDLGEEEQTIPLILEEIKNSKIDTNKEDLPGIEMYQIKNNSNFLKMKQELKNIINNNYSMGAKRNAAYVLLQYYKYRNPNELWSLQKDKKSKIETMGLMKYLNDPKALKIIEEKGTTDEDTEVRIQANKIVKEISGK